MPKKGETWTPERRAQYEARKGNLAVAESEYDDELMRPDGKPIEQDGAEMLSNAEMFVARMHAKGAVETIDDLDDTEDITEPGGGSNVEHKSAGLVWMYKHETWGWRRLKVSRNGLDELVRAGLRDRCGSCGSSKCPGTVNGCPKGKMRMYRDCPVPGCNDGRGKRFYDMMDTTAVREEPESPFAIKDDAYENSTPESRTKAMLDAHIRAWHEQEAMARGLMNITSQPTVASR